MFRTSLFGFILMTATAAVSQNQAVSTETQSQSFARERLMEMAGFLGNVPAFDVTLQVAYEVLQDSGQMIEFSERRQVSVQRPYRVRVLEYTSHGENDMMLFDGRNITSFNGSTGRYAQSRQPGTIDQTIIHYVRDLKMRLPLAPLLMQGFNRELERRVLDIDYVEYTDILARPAHHIAARTANVDFQVWIADGKYPLPLRIVMNYRTEKGHPHFRADFYQWDLSPDFNADSFSFNPPAGAKRIPYAAQLLQLQNQGARP